MSFFNGDQDQPIDYTNKYNENIGSISPKSNNYDSHLTSYHSNNLFRNDDYSTLNQTDRNNQQLNNQQNFNQQQFNNQHLNQQQLNQQFNNSNKVLDNDCIKNNYSFLFQDTTDCVTIYQTEDSPIIYSNDSPLSALSLEFLPNLNPNDNLLNNKQFNDYQLNSNNDFQLNSSNDSIQNYNMEGTPNCFSYDSPLSPLSLNTSFDDCNSSPFDLNSRMNSIKELKNKKDSDLKSMISIMSIDKSKQSSINSSNNKLNKISFGQLDNDSQKNTQFNQEQFNKEQSDKEKFNKQQFNKQQFNKEQFEQEQFNQITHNFLNNLVNQQNNQQSQNNFTNICKTIDFEDGFEEYDNEQFYLNKCIIAGRQTNNRNLIQQFNSNQTFENQINQRPKLNEIQSLNNQEEQLNREEIPYYKINTIGSFNKKDLIKQINQKQQLTSNQQQNLRFNQQQFNQTNQTYLNQQKQDKFKYPCSVDMGYYSNKDNDTSTVITDFTQKYGSRSAYTIDGEVEKRELSVRNAKISNLPLNYIQLNQQQQDEKLYLQKQQQQQFRNSSLDNSPKQTKKSSLKKMLGFNLFNTKK